MNFKGLIPTHDQTVKYGTILKSIYYIEIYCRKHQKSKYPEEMQIELMQIQSNYLRERANFSYLCFEDTLKTQKITKRRIAENPPAKNPKEFVSGMEQQKRIKRILKSQKMDDFIDLEDRESQENEVDEEDLFKPNSVDSSPRERKLKPNSLERKTAPIQKKSFDHHFKNINSDDSSPPRANKIIANAPKKAAISTKNLQSNPRKSFNPKPLKKNSIPRNSKTFTSYPTNSNNTATANFTNTTPYQRNIGNFLMDKTSESSSITQSDDVKRRKFVIKKAAPKPEKEKNEGIYDKFAKLFDEIESDKRPENSESHAKQESSLASVKIDIASNKRKTSGSHDLSQDEAVEPHPRKKMKLMSESNFSSALHIKTARPMNLKPLVVDSSEDEKSELFPEERKSIHEEEEEKKEDFAVKNNNLLNLMNSNRLPVIKEGIEIEKEHTPEKDGFSLNEVMKGFDGEGTKIDNSSENLLKPLEIQNISPILSQLHQSIIPSKQIEIAVPEDEKVTITLKQLLAMENTQNEKSSFIEENQFKFLETTNSLSPVDIDILQQKIPNNVQISEKPIEEEFKEEKIKKILKNELLPQNEKPPNIQRAASFEKPSIKEDPSDIFEDPTNFEERKNHPKVAANNNPINENQDNNDDEIKYLETHKPEKKIEIRKEKLKKLMPAVEVKAARNNKEYYYFYHPTHVWGVVTSLALKMEFDNTKDLVAKLSEDFLGLKMKLDS